MVTLVKNGSKEKAQMLVDSVLEKLRRSTSLQSQHSRLFVKNRIAKT